MVQPDFEKFEDGLIPVVVQSADSLEVIMHAYTNKEAWEKTLETGLVTYWSRSRQEIWVKGLTSGHTQKIKDIFIDCDRDTLLFIVEQAGAACHLGYQSCFFRRLDSNDWTIDNPPVVDMNNLKKK